MAYFYLAGPYSGNEKLNAKLHANVLHKLLTKHEVVFSPIVHCHDLAVEMNLPKDFSYWCNYALEMLAPASKLYVICSDGWKDSNGLTAEISLAKQLGIPIEYITIFDELYPKEVIQ